jgi:hypothetical protein
MRLRALSTLALIAVARPAAADWAYTKWGMTPEQVVKAAAGTAQITKSESTDDPDLEMRVRGTYMAGPLRFEVTFGFRVSTGGLAFVSYWTDQAGQNAALKDLLVQKYGKPQSTQGTEQGVETWTWNRPGTDRIELDIPVGDPGVVIQYPATP